MRIALYPNGGRDHHFQYTKRLAEMITAHGARAVIEDGVAPELPSDVPVERASYSTCDVMIVLGGDGTFLSASHLESALELPKTGINLGSVGFLLEAEPDQLDDVVKKLIQGDFRVEQRPLLAACHRCLEDAAQPRRRLKSQEPQRAQEAWDAQALRGAGEAQDTQELYPSQHARWQTGLQKPQAPRGQEESEKLKGSRNGALAYALNDVVLARGSLLKSITVALSIDGKTVGHIPGDGIIVSTPTGSTAYALSAGGPILDPALDVILITSICPHTLHNRSFVVRPDAVIQLELVREDVEAYLSVDGHMPRLVEYGDIVTVRKASHTLPMIKFREDVFFEKLPAKIRKRGALT